MSDFQTVHVIGLLVALLIVLRAFSFRRMRPSQIAGTLLSWVLIGALIFIGVNHRQEIGAFVADVQDRLGYGAQKAEGQTVRIRMSPDGHFWARVQINGVERRMLVDSGATVTALSEGTANAANVEQEKVARVQINTANGVVPARMGNAEEVTVGPLAMRDLNVVVAPSFGTLDVLGMNFLSRLKSWRVEGRTLILEPEGATETVDQVEEKRRRRRASTTN